MEDRKNNTERKTKVSEKDIQTIIQYIEAIQYGSIILIIQDGHIVQIEKNEKIRIK